MEIINGKLIDNQKKQKKESIPQESGVTAKPISDKLPQENYEQSVEPKGLPNTKEGVSTTESGDGESPVANVLEKEIKIKSKEVKNGKN
ncbi:MAG: hypothetical protein ACFFG0_03290 [Candidatus Thorarchaeota archaeon]